MHMRVVVPLLLILLAGGQGHAASYKDLAARAKAALVKLSPKWRAEQRMAAHIKEQNAWLAEVRLETARSTRIIEGTRLLTNGYGIRTLARNRAVAAAEMRSSLIEDGMSAEEADRQVAEQMKNFAPRSNAKTLEHLREGARALGGLSGDPEHVTPGRTEY
jgi:hypothetical protein